MYWYIVHYQDLNITLGNELFATLANNKQEAKSKLIDWMGDDSSISIIDILPISRKDLAELGCSQWLPTDVENISSFIKDEYFAPKEECL